MPGLFEGRNALVTGASSGIGRGVALALAAGGARVAVNYPDYTARAAAEAVVAEITNRGGMAIAVQADVSNVAEVETMIGTTEREVGPLDILISNAGIARAGAAHEMAVVDWDRVIAVHLRGAFLVSRKVLPGMYTRGYGRVIFTASQLAYKGAAGFSAYTAAKGGIISLTRTLALEAGASGVTVNSVAPGATKTPILADVPADILETVRTSIPVGRLAEIDDIVPTYVFLASESARHFQGQCLSPNGGDVFL
ncbi:MAG: SDR family NAD(P)-dependent oxidoreductase [Rhodobacterales bacterium]|nr:SDR family NAD(P)-dependent oxidoreductase [Rhodobacterales bacterium]